MQIIRDKKLQDFWINFIKHFKNKLNLKENDLNKILESERKIILIKEHLIKELQKLKNELLKIGDDKLTIEEYKFVKDLTKIMNYIVKYHPYMSSKYEDIILIKPDGEKKIKSEALIGDNLLDDELIKETLISSRYELINIITKHKLLKNIGIELTLKHVETAIYINQSKTLKEKLSINISEEEIINDDFFEKLKIIKKNLKEKLNIDIQDIIQFELLEYEIDLNNPKIWKKLKRLKSIGIDLSIDDYGSNFSNLKRINDIRKNQGKELEYIKTIKIDKKITSAVAYKKFKKHLLKKEFHASSKPYAFFLDHLSNIIEIPYLNLKSVLEEHIDKNIDDIINEINKNYKINVEEIVNKEYQKYTDLIEYLHTHNLITKINLVFEYIDNEIVKDIIAELSNDVNIEILAQGYYFKESLKPIYHQEIKEYINKFIINLENDSK